MTHATKNKRRSKQGTKRTHRTHACACAYTWFDELSASPMQPLAPEKQAYQVARMREALHELCTAPNPTVHAWRVVSDAANLLETMIEQGYAQDPEGLLKEVIRELATAGDRYLQRGVPLRLSGAGIKSLTYAIDDYADAIAELPARDVIHIHRATEKRMAAILSGQARPHDVKLVSV